VWSLAKTFEAGRMLPLTRKESAFIDFSTVHKDVLFFAAGGKYNIFDHFYCDQHLDNPLRAHLSLERFGNTSLLLNQHLCDSATGETLAQLFMTFVITDRKTRKPYQIPARML
jgi:hypothetical protein